MAFCSMDKPFIRPCQNHPLHYFSRQEAGALRPSNGGYMMSEQEEDIINRMHKLVGNRWGLIAGRVPGRKPEEIETYWLMTHGNITTTACTTLKTPKRK